MLANSARAYDKANMTYSNIPPGMCTLMFGVVGYPVPRGCVNLAGLIRATASGEHPSAGEPPLCMDGHVGPLVRASYMSPYMGDKPYQHELVNGQPVLLELHGSYMSPSIVTLHELVNGKLVLLEPCALDD